MTAEELINPSIPALSPLDTVARALSVMAKAGREALPLVSEGVFVGMVTEKQLSDLPDRKIRLESLPPYGTANQVPGSRHMFDIPALSQTGGQLDGLSAIAVTGPGGTYLGSTSLADFAAAFSGIWSTQTPGSIIELSMPERDYSLSQIARLTESNGVKIIQSFTDTEPGEPSHIRLTLKLNQLDPSRVIATLERFGYAVTSRSDFGETISPDKERLDILLKYLSI